MTEPTHYNYKSPRLVCWEQYKETERYKQTIKSLLRSGVKELDADNALYSAYLEGFNDCKESLSITE